MWPIDDSTMKSDPRNRAMVFALAGDSTMTSGLGMGASRLGVETGQCQHVESGRRSWGPPRCGSVAAREWPGLPVDPRHLIETFGTLGVIAIVFAETGLLIGFFLPGDSLLFT